MFCYDKFINRDLDVTTPLKDIHFLKVGNTIEN